MFVPHWEHTYRPPIPVKGKTLLFYLLNSHMISQLIGWLIAWLVDWLINWLNVSLVLRLATGWCFDSLRLVGSSTGCLADCLVAQQSVYVDYLPSHFKYLIICWLCIWVPYDWLIDWLIDMAVSTTLFIPLSYHQGIVLSVYLTQPRYEVT
jgi:hypothetical protein